MPIRFHLRTRGWSTWTRLPNPVGQGQIPTGNSVTGKSVLMNLSAIRTCPVPTGNAFAQGFAGRRVMILDELNTPFYVPFESIRYHRQLSQPNVEKNSRTRLTALCMGPVRPMSTLRHGCRLSANRWHTATKRVKSSPGIPPETGIHSALLPVNRSAKKAKQPFPLPPEPWSNHTRIWDRLHMGLSERCQRVHF